MVGHVGGPASRCCFSVWCSSAFLSRPQDIRDAGNVRSACAVALAHMRHCLATAFVHVCGRSISEVASRAQESLRVPLIVNAADFAEEQQKSPLWVLTTKAGYEKL